MRTCEDDAPLADADAETRLTAIIAAVLSYLDSQHGWENIWMQWQKGRITDGAYRALRRLGTLAGSPDPRTVPEFDESRAE